MTRDYEGRRRLLRGAIGLGLGLMVGPAREEPGREGQTMTFELHSGAFRNGEPIPPRHTCQGENISPPLAWSGAPAGTRGFALICYDPDAPGRTFYHWAVFGLPADRAELPERLPKGAPGLHQAVNDFGAAGYGGPCPPPGHGIHHYHFELLALSVPALQVPPGAGALEVQAAAKRHLLARAELIGLYSR